MSKRWRLPEDHPERCPQHGDGPYVEEGERVLGCVRIRCDRCAHWAIVETCDLEPWTSCTCDLWRGCTCGVFVREMQERGLRRNWVTKVWERPW